MNGQNKTRVALLIDADNLSGDVIEQAVAHLLKTFGAIDFRRAYSSPQKVIEHTELFRRHAIRPMVNVPTGKNSTDIALAVDAIDLAISERPDVVVIGSSDSDYAPLAQRLREKGCRVLGIGQAGKTGGESPLAYDEFIDLAHRKTPRPVLVRDADPAPPPVARARSQPARSRSRTPAALPSDVQDILKAFPALRDGAEHQLGEIGKALREHQILKSKSASPSGHLKKLPGYFELTPADKPRTVRFIGASSG